MPDTPTAPRPMLHITQEPNGDWRIATGGVLTNDQAAEITFTAGTNQVRLGAFVAVIDAGGTRIGHVANAHLVKRAFGPDYVVVGIELR